MVHGCRRLTFGWSPAMARIGTSSVEENGKVQGGYPTLHHGGLSLLEVFVPIIELSQMTSDDNA
jgi:hypothetical protein